MNVLDLYEKYEADPQQILIDYAVPSSDPLPAITTKNINVFADTGWYSLDKTRIFTVLSKMTDLIQLTNLKYQLDADVKATSLLAVQNVLTNGQLYGKLDTLNDRSGVLGANGSGFNLSYNGNRSVCTIAEKSWSNTRDSGDISSRFKRCLVNRHKCINTINPKLYKRLTFHRFLSMGARTIDKTDSFNIFRVVVNGRRKFRQVHGYT